MAIDMMHTVLFASSLHSSPNIHSGLPPTQPSLHSGLLPITVHSLTGAPPSPPIQLHTPSRNTSFTNIYVLQLCRLYPHSTSLSSTANTVPLYFRPLSSTPYRPTPLQSSAVSSVQLNLAKAGKGRQRQASRQACRQTTKPPMRGANM